MMRIHGYFVMYFSVKKRVSPKVKEFEKGLDGITYIASGMMLEASGSRGKRIIIALMCDLY